MLTLGDIKHEAWLTLRHEIDARVNDVRFANRVGRRWVNLHPSGGWRYLTGRTHIIEWVDGQRDYPLPDNAREIQTIVGNESDFVPIDLVSSVRAATWHVSDSRDFGSFYGRFLGYIPQETRPDGSFGPVLRVTPVPSGGLPDARVVYRAGWTALESDDDIADIPDWAEEGFMDLVRAMAQGYHRVPSSGDPDPIPALVARVVAGPEFLAAVDADALIEPFIEEGIGAMQEVELDENRRRYVGPRFTNQDLLQGPGIR